MKKRNFERGVYLVACVVIGVWSIGARSARAGDKAMDDDFHDASNPAMEHVQPPEWLQRDNSAIKPPDSLPNAMSDAEQEACTLKILKYVNDKFHTSYTEDNLAPIQLPDWNTATRGFVRGGGYNIRIQGYQSMPLDPDTGIKQRKLHSGRYMPWAGYLELGIHATLHIPGSIGGYQTFTSREVGDKEYLVDFVAHIDSADPWEPPAGSLYHLFVDVIGSSTRNPCPGKE